jgi:hypothetical protein
MSWAGLVTYMEETSNAYKILGLVTEGKHHSDSLKGMEFLD